MKPAKVKDRKFTMDGIMKENLDLCKELIKQDIDYVFLIDGPVGSGKSVFAQQLGYYVSDGDFGVDDVVFTPEQFIERVRSRERYKAIVWDECFRGLAGSGTMSKINREITQLLLECRDRNLFIFLVTPSFWDIQKKTIRDRIKGVIHCKLGFDKARRKVIRGGFSYHSNRQIVSFMDSDKNKNKIPRTSTFYGEWRWRYRVIDKDGNYKLAPLYQDKYTYMVGSKEYLAKKRAVLGDKLKAEG